MKKNVKTYSRTNMEFIAFQGLNVNHIRFETAISSSCRVTAQGCTIEFLQELGRV